MDLFTVILEWSEVWALLIPLAVIIGFPTRRYHERPIVIYVIIALVLNSISTIIYIYNTGMPAFLKNNNIYYNLHSIARVFFFGWYIIINLANKRSPVYRFLFAGYGIFILLNFIFIKSIFFFSTWLFAAESMILLFLCVSYFLQLIQDDSRVQMMKHPSFLVCTGLILYEAITFFIFLFIIPLAKIDPDFGLLCLKIYKITFIILCIMLAAALYKSRILKSKPTN